MIISIYAKSTLTIADKNLQYQLIYFYYDIEVLK